MARPPVDEIQILRYFEAEPVEKAAVLFKIVSEKMRERLGGRRDSAPKSSTTKEPAVAKRSHPAPDRDTLPDPSAVKPGA